MSLNLFVHAPSTQVSAERRLPSDIPVAELRYRLEVLVGVPPSHQVLELHASRTDDPTSPSSLLLSLTPELEARSLEQLGATHGNAIKVLDTRPAVLVQTFTDESLVDKYEMDDKTYQQRSDTVLAFKQRNKLGRFDPNATKDHQQIDPKINVGERCEVQAQTTRRGTVRFIGPTQFAQGVWVGVQYDEPVGKNDGSVNGERYFSCRPNYGGFVKQDKVTTGHFPEEEINLDSDDEEM